MRLIELKAERFKRLKAVRINPTDPVTPIVGRNGAGKTSVLDAISAALGGASASPELPIRVGETQAEVVVDLGDIVVRRRWTAKGSTLEVVAANGVKVSSPQAMLDKLVGSLSFDPLAFGRMKPADQAETLAKICGVDLAAYEVERKQLFEARRAANAAAKSAKAVLDSTPIVEAPAEPVSVTALMAELSAARETHAREQKATAQVVKCESVLAETEKGIVAREAKIEELRAEIAKVEAEIQVWKKHYAEKESGLALAKEAVAKAQSELIDTAPIEQRIRDSEAINTAVRKRQDRERLEADWKAKDKVAIEADKNLSALEAKHDKTIKSSSIPVPGLAFTSSGVTFGGVPFAQCSGAERLRVSVSIGLALHPKLKLMLIRDGSLLDSDGMRILAEIAEKADAQILIERVDNGGEVGVQIVDGETVEVEVAVKSRNTESAKLTGAATWDPNKHG